MINEEGQGRGEEGGRRRNGVVKARERKEKSGEDDAK